MEQLKGYVEHIIYRNGDNGYTVMNFISGEEEVVCVGSFRTIDQGETPAITWSILYMAHSLRWRTIM